MSDVIQILRDRFEPAMRAAVGSQAAPFDPVLAPSSNARFGDYQANAAMSLGRRLKRKPRDVADAIVEHLEIGDVCVRVEVAGPGFINLHLNEAFLNDQMAGMASDARLGVPPTESPQTVVVDYSCPNMAKEMHIGHIRSSCIGDCLARILDTVGHRVTRQNHVGDWGTQFGMLVEHLLDGGWDGAAGRTIADLDDLYRDSKRRFDEELGFADRSRQRVVQLQGGDEQVLRIWRMLIEESIRHMNTIYGRLGLLLNDEDIRGESFYNPMLAGIVSDLRSDGILAESQGAMVVFSDRFVDPDGRPLPLIVQKRDGGYPYATTDLAALRFRVRQVCADRILYVTDPRQAQHFAMLFEAARKAGWADGAVRLEHVAFGTILGKDRKPFKTREGGTVKLLDVLDEVERRARAVIDGKNPDLPEDERARIARVVGIGALKYADLSNDRIKDYVFDWDRMLALEGNTAPYLQNAYVRIRSIFRKGSVDREALRAPGDPAERGFAFDHDQERAVAVRLIQFATVVTSVADTCEPHRLCTYLYELAAAFHQFYEKCPVLNADAPDVRDCRLRLCDLTASVLQTGLGLLGIEVVERM